MQVTIAKTTEPISQIIQQYCGPVLNDRDIMLFQRCQVLGTIYSGFIDDQFVCCWGLIPPTFISNQAYLWMWNKEPMEHPFVLIRQSQIQVQEMLKYWNRIVGHCQIEARSARRWLRWLGAEFGGPSNGLIPFVIRRPE